MRLLVITQKVDSQDPILGFFHAWLTLFAKHVDSLYVICLEEGRHALPSNVSVYSLGKERGYSRVRYVWRFYRTVWRLRNEHDAVFVHMNQIYVILGGMFWKMWRKPIGLWYLHKKVSFSLRIAEKIADVIFTASKKSFRLPSDKVRIVGHGIDTSYFVPPQAHILSSPLVLCTAGRIAKVKNLHLLLETLLFLKKQGVESVLKIAGIPVTEDDIRYKERLEEWIRKHNMKEDVVFVGAKANREMLAFYHGADVCVNLSDTGSVDKAVLEAMACNMRIVTTNEAFQDILPEGAYVDGGTAHSIGEAILRVSQTPQPLYRAIVEERYGLSRLVPKMLGIVKELPRG